MWGMWQIQILIQSRIFFIFQEPFESNNLWDKQFQISKYVMHVTNILFVIWYTGFLTICWWQVSRIWMLSPLMTWLSNRRKNSNIHLTRMLLVKKSTARQNTNIVKIEKYLSHPAIIWPKIFTRPLTRKRRYNIGSPYVRGPRISQKPP